MSTSHTVSKQLEAASATVHATLQAESEGEGISVRTAFLLDDIDSVPDSIAGFMEAGAVEKSGGDVLVVPSTADGLDIKLTNSYTETSPVEVGEYAYPWTYVAEPYVATKMTAVNADSEAWYKWTVAGHTQGYGQTVDVAFTSKGWNTVVLTEKKNGMVTATVAIKVMVKYVRREIRSLTDLDRERFFQAISIMSVVPTETGQGIFGQKYKSKDYFNRIHLYYGGTADCDHWHQGAGFVTSHVALTLEFEQGIQSIYPSLSMPYWDFTMESTFYGPKDWRDSTVFAESWFGAASPSNDLHTVTTGRFAFTTAMTNARNFSRIVNSYGVLRAPWNNDPTPFMTRHDHIYGFENNLKPSGCKEYYIAMKKNTWMSMSKQLNSAAHGHIHETVGGSWNHYYAERLNHQGSPAVLSFAHEIQALSKNLWRTGFVTCPESCSMDTAWTDCQCSCDADAIAGMRSYDVLDQAGVLASADYFDTEDHVINKFYDENGTIYYELPHYTEEQSKLIYDDMLSMLCSPGHIGDMFQATSSNDITFWVLHGTLDRLWHFKRLGNMQNYDETWDPYHTCYGHNPTNFQPFKNLFDSDDRYYTNIELYEYFRPHQEALQYMYDNFQWPHCELLGYEMSNKW